MRLFSLTVFKIVELVTHPRRRRLPMKNHVCALLLASSIAGLLGCVNTVDAAPLDTELTLQNGWTNAPFGTRNAGATAVMGIVYLRGAIANGTSPIAFTLPAEMRPAKNVYVPVDLCNATKGRLVIQPSGVVSIEAEGGTFANARCFTSLEGVSFAPSDVGFTALALTNGWTHAPFGTSNASALKINGVVHLKGAIARGTSPVITTLASDLRPATSVYVPVDLCNVAKGRLVIQPSGMVSVEAQGGFSRAQCFTSLDGVSFAQATTAVTTLSLTNGWTHAPFGTRSAAVKNFAGVVQFEGAIAGGNNSVAFTLPSEFRPPKNVYVPINLCNTTKGRLFIQPSGAVSIETEGSAFANARCFTSLDRATFVMDLGQSKQRLTGGAFSTVPSWVVGVTFDDGFCSASVLSEHVLLTAAHCVTGLGGNITVQRASGLGLSQTIYTGQASFVKHPNYEAGILLDPEDDFALVLLKQGAINLSLTGRAKLYSDGNPLWTLPVPQGMTFAGWGMTGAAGAVFCSGTGGFLMLANPGTVLRPAGAGQKDMTAPLGPIHICPGDSGSPWLFSRGGDFAVFAVTSGMWFDFTGPIMKASTILPKLGWIFTATRASGGGCNRVECFEEYLNCRPAGTLVDLSYHQCFEVRTVTGPPPPPGSACPVGQRCCEPGTDRCMRCISNQQQCP
jgi:hypothetical protein